MTRIVLAVLMMTATMSTAQDLTFADLQGVDKKPKGDFASYTARNGEVFKVGDKITIGQPSTGHLFNFIEIGDNVMVPIQKCPSRAAGEVIEIKRIFVEGRKDGGWYAVLRTVGGMVGYSVKTEQAIDAGELVTSVMTSDQALAELKKAKDKLDLGLITADEYEALKADLSRHIK